MDRAAVLQREAGEAPWHTCLCAAMKQVGSPAWARLGPWLGRARPCPAVPTARVALPTAYGL